MSLITPKVSVVMSAYNAGKFVREAISSILSQNFGDFELLIYNDGSDDNTEEVIKSMVDDRIVYTAFKENSGIVRGLNEGIKNAKGEYIAIMAADDISNVERLQKQVDCLDNFPAVGICGSWLEQFGTIKSIVKKPVSFEEIKLGLLSGCSVTHGTIMIRKKFLLDHNLFFSEKYRYSQDYYFFWRSSLCFQIVNIPEVLYYYRMHDSQVSNLHWKKQYRFKGYIQTEIFGKLLNNNNEDVRKWLENFFVGEADISNNFENNFGFFLNQLKEKNRETRTFDNIQFEKTLNEIFNEKKKQNILNHFQRKYVQIRKFNPGLIFDFFKEDYSGYKYLGVKQFFYFIIKSLLFYRKKSVLPV